MSEDERTYECEDCHHVYTERYGRWVAFQVPVGGQERWLCHDCIAKRKARQAK